MPRVWILQSPHSGDNTQLRALAAALGWPSEVKRLTYRRHEGLLRLLSLPTLAGVDLAALEPARRRPGRISSSAPAAGRRPWPSGSSSRTRSSASSSSARPGPASTRFDLVITTPQYRLPQAPNVLHNMLPAA